MRGREEEEINNLTKLIDEQKIEMNTAIKTIKDDEAISHQRN